MTNETRYMRQDTQLINGLTAYKLETTRTTSYIEILFNQYDGNVTVTQYMGIKVWKRDLNGNETLLQDINAIASGGTTGLKTATIGVSLASLVTTDSIVVRVYGGDSSPPTILLATFTTGQLGATSLTAITWTLSYYLYRYYNSGLGLTNYYFRFGTSAYDSKIANFDYTTVVAPTVTTQDATDVGRD